MAKRPTDEKLVVSNKKARYDYQIEDVYEAGLVLEGSEVKSLRQGKGSLADAYAVVEGGEVYLLGSHIPTYAEANRFNHEPLRKRKLLMRRSEIKRLTGQVKERGYTLVALEIYFKKGWAKVRLGLGKGKRLYDKRETIRRRDQDRELAQGGRR